MMFVLTKSLVVLHQHYLSQMVLQGRVLISAGQTMLEHLAGKLNMEPLDLHQEREQVLSLRLTLIPYLD